MADILKLADYLGDISLIAEKGFPKGPDPGWPSMYDHYRPYPGYMTTITGIPGHGKSEWLDALLVNLAWRYGMKFAIFSPENFPVSIHAIKMIEKMAGTKIHLMTKEGWREAAKWVDDHFSYLYPTEEECTLPDILRLVDQVKQTYGAHGFVIDPWNEIEHRRTDGMSETEYISQSLTRVRRFSREKRIHAWIVAHPTKLQKNRETGKYDPPDPYSISGCHSEDTEVLTSDGWVKHGEVTISHKVACFSLEKNILLYQHPIKTWEYDHSGEMFRFKGPSFDALVTPNHRMVVRPSWRKKHKMIGSGMGRPKKYPRNGDWSFIEAKDFCGDMEMPWATPLYGGDDADEIIGYNADMFLRFVGWWIAEGWFAKKVGGIGICQGVGRLADNMSETMKMLGIDFSEAVGGPGTGGTIKMWKAYIRKKTNKDLIGWMVENCGVCAKNKKIPNMVWSISLRQKEILLQALIDGDGTSQRRDTFSYSTTSRQLADDIQRLCVEVGRMATISEVIGSKRNHARQFSLSIGRKDRKHISVRKARNVTIEKYTGKVYCLTVPTGAYLVRRNGLVGIYGNSSHWRNKSDFCITCHRDDFNKNEISVHVNKVKFKHFGKIGRVDLDYDWKSGRFKEKLENEYRLPIQDRR